MSLDEVADFKGAYDIPNKNDFIAEHVVGDPLDEVIILKSVNLNKVPSHNQGKSWHCTAYALTHIEEILNTLEHEMIVSLDPEEQWKNQCDLHGVPSTISGGDSLQNALNALVKNGLKNIKNPDIDVPVFKITGYAQIEKTVESFQKWLCYNMPLFTGSGTHCYAIIGYDDGKRVFIAKNSYGPEWGRKGDGTFEIPYNDLSKLFTTYIVYDQKDVQFIFRDVTDVSPNAKDIAEAAKLGLMKGYGEEGAALKEKFFRPEQPITRSELATVMVRLYNLLKT